MSSLADVSGSTNRKPLYYESGFVQSGKSAFSSCPILQLLIPDRDTEYVQEKTDHEIDQREQSALGHFAQISEGLKCRAGQDFRYTKTLFPSCHQVTEWGYRGSFR